MIALVQSPRRCSFERAIMSTHTGTSVFIVRVGGDYDRRTPCFVSSKVGMTALVTLFCDYRGHEGVELFREADDVEAREVRLRVAQLALLRLAAEHVEIPGRGRRESRRGTIVGRAESARSARGEGASEQAHERRRARGRAATRSRRVETTRASGGRARCDGAGGATAAWAVRSSARPAMRHAASCGHATIARGAARCYAARRTP